MSDDRQNGALAALQHETRALMRHRELLDDQLELAGRALKAAEELWPLAFPESGLGPGGAPAPVAPPSRLLHETRRALRRVMHSKQALMNRRG